MGQASSNCSTSACCDVGTERHLADLDNAYDSRTSYQLLPQANHIQQQKLDYHLNQNNVERELPIEQF